MPTKARLRRSPLLWTILSLSENLHTPLDEVMTWSLSRIKLWWTYFQLKADLDHEAMEEARKKAEKASKLRQR